MKKSLAAICLVVSLFAAPAKAVDAWYLGAQIGHVALTGSASTVFSNAIGFGLDLGFRTNPILDINLSLLAASHSGAGGLTLFSQTASADVRILDINDFEGFIGGGPGFYFFKTTPGTTSNFGLNIGAHGNVMVDENIRIGLGTKYHFVFGNADNFWTIMMRFGYLFDTSGA